MQLKVFSIVSQVSIQVLFSVFVVAENVEVVSVDLYVTSDGHIWWGNECTTIVHIFVLSSFEELSFHNAGVLLSWLKDRDSVISQVERNNEASLKVLRNASVESSNETKDLVSVINVLEEVSFRFLRDKSINVTKGIIFSTKSVIRRNYEGLSLSWFRLFNVTKFKVLSEFGLIEFLCKFIDTEDAEDATKGV